MTIYLLIKIPWFYNYIMLKFLKPAQTCSSKWDIWEGSLDLIPYDIYFCILEWSLL